jgi:hypothetical protein
VPASDTHDDRANAGRAKTLRRIYLSIVCLALASSLIFSVGAVSLLFQQTLLPPNVVHVGAMPFCTTPLLNMTSPSTLFDNSNGTVLYGCTILTDNSGIFKLSPAVQVTRAGSLSSTFTLPSGVNLFLIPNSLGLTPMSQNQCASSGILLNTNATFTIPVGTYSYCESFARASLLVPVTVSWYQ